MYLKSIIYLYIHNTTYPYIYIYIYINYQNLKTTCTLSTGCSQATFFGKPADRPLWIMPQDLVTFAPPTFSLEGGEQRRWCRSFPPSLGEVHRRAVVPMGSLGILGFCITRWWVVFPNSSEKYGIIKLDHFPQVSGWTLKLIWKTTT